MRAILTVGISGSGKTTWAEDFCAQNEGWVNINRDDIRFNGGHRDWTKYKFTKANENKVTEAQQNLIWIAANEQFNIVISDTNLSEKTRLTLTTTLKDYGYEVEEKPFPITLEEAWKRNAQRYGGLPHDRVYAQYQQWLTYIGRKRYVADKSLPRAIIVDIDGTIAKMNGRGPFDWHRVGEDDIRTEVMSIVEGFQGAAVVVSGRDSVCRSETLRWLSKAGVETEILELYMRKEGDTRKDTVVKEEIFWQYIAPNFNVVAVVDDRPSVVRLWHELGIENVICVGNPWEEF